MFWAGFVTGVVTLIVVELIAVRLLIGSVPNMEDDIGE